MQAGLKAGDSLTGLDDLLADRTARWRSCARRRGDRAGAADHPLLAEALASLDRALIEASEAEDRIARAAELWRSTRRGWTGRGAAVRYSRPGAQASRRARRSWPRLASRCARSCGDRGRRRTDRGTRPAAGRRARASSAAAEAQQAAERGRPRLDAAVAAELSPLKLDAARFRTAIAPGRARAVGHRPGRVRGVDQSRRAVRAADPDRVGRRVVALHPGAEGGAGRSGKRGDDDLRRGRPRRRRGGRQRDRRTAGAARGAMPGAGRHPLAAGRGSRRAPLSNREEPRRRWHADHGPQAHADERREESPGCCRALPSPRKRGRRHRACSTRRDRLRRAASRREPRLATAAGWTTWRRIADELGLRACRGPSSPAATCSSLATSARRAQARARGGVCRAYGRARGVMVRTARKWPPLSRAILSQSEPGNALRLLHERSRRLRT